MNLLRTLFKGTERASTRRRLSTWNDHRTRLGKCEMPKHRASKATVLTMSLDWELHAKTAFLSQIFEHSENESWQVHCQKKKAYKHNRNGQHSEAARSMKWAVVDMFAKSESGTREICSQLEKREKHTFDFNIQYFWSRTQEIPKMSFGDLKVGIFGPSWRPRNAKE